MYMGQQEEIDSCSKEGIVNGLCVEGVDMLTVFILLE